jgi:uncharacterized protein (TIGR02678 family)
VIAEGIRTTDLGAYQRTVRTLLVHPLVTTTHPDDTTLAAVRRFLPQLSADLGEVAGYRVEVAPTCARLVRRVDRPDPTQAVRRGDGTPFDRRRYAYLCLVLAALGRAGTQVTLTELAHAVRRRAGEIDGLGFDPDTYRHRLAFADAIRHLLRLGGLKEVETSAADWVRDPDAGEALYDLDRDVLHQVVVAPRVLQHVTSASELLAAAALETTATRDGRRAAVRQRLCRLLLEHPVVYLDDLDDATRTYVTSQGRVLAEDLHRLTGAQLERRAEGLALIDTAGGFSDRRFPVGGTAAQVALLLADRIAARVEHVGGAEGATVPGADHLGARQVAALDAARTLQLVTDASDAEVVATDRATWRAPLCTDGWLHDVVAELIARHGRTFAADLRDDPVALTDAALDVLEAFDLVRRVEGGVVALPAIARYRDVAVTVAAPQPSLLGDATEEPA